MNAIIGFLILAPFANKYELAPSRQFAN